ncbi:MAG: hypothetical protein R2856_12365 [Caldilineaceae bacterium]
MASSNHAADYYEPLILRHRWDFVTPDMRALSDNYYGWAKEVYEHLGFVFAVGKNNGSPLENVQIRIGGPRETDLDMIELEDLVMPGRWPLHQSTRSGAVGDKSIETEDIHNEQGVPFQVVYGISENNQAFWGLANARRVLGYAPQDGSELRFANKIQQHIKATQKRGS